MASYLSVFLTCISTLAASPSDTSGIAGTWRGRSVCVTDAAACHNEEVVYYIKDVFDRDDVVFIQADKLVDGKAVTMGAGQWQYDRKQHTLECVVGHVKT
jgi:hypothetical protein